MANRLRSLIVFCFVCLSVTADEPGLHAEVGQRSVEITGIPPRAEVVVYSYQRRPLGFESLASRRVDVISDDDGDGAITVNSAEDIEPRSIWIVVELTSGRYVISSPAAFTPNITTVTPGAFRKSGGTAADRFVDRHPSLDVLYVHPGKGARFAMPEDGGLEDADGRTDGRTTMALANARAVAGSAAAPVRFDRGGIFIAVDRMTMQIVAGRLTGADLGEAP